MKPILASQMSRAAGYTMKIRFFCFLVLSCVLVFAISPPLFAQAQSKPLTLADCIRLAQSVPSPASVAKLDSDIARLDVRQAQAALLPKSELEADFTYNSPLRGRSPVQSFVALNGVREYQFLLSASQEIDISGRLRAELALSRAQYRAALANTAISERDFKRAVTAAYFRLLLTRHLEVALRDSLAESENFEKRTKLLFDQGEVARADLVKASATASGLRQQYNAAQIEAQITNNELAAFWTKDFSTPLDIEDVFEQAITEERGVSFPLGTSAILQRPEFKLLEAQREAFLQQARRARAGLLPQANVKFQYGLDSNQVQARDRGYAFFAELKMPVFNWLNALNAIRQARKREEQVRQTRAVAERIFSRDLENAQTRVKMLQEQIRFAEMQMKASEEDVRLSRIRYDGGEGSALDVVTAQSQLAQARATYYNAIANYLNAKAEREVAAGLR
jgi:outer membrane protein